MEQETRKQATVKELKEYFALLPDDMLIESCNPAICRPCYDIHELFYISFSENVIAFGD